MSSDSSYLATGNPPSGTSSGEDSVFEKKPPKHVKPRRSSSKKTVRKSRGPPVKRKQKSFSLPNIGDVDLESAEKKYFAKLYQKDPKKHDKPKVDGNRHNSKVITLERKKFIQRVLDHKIKMKKLEYKLSSSATLAREEVVEVEKELEALEKATSYSFPSGPDDTSEEKLLVSMFNSKWINQFSYIEGDSKTLWNVVKGKDTDRDESFPNFWIRPRNEVTQIVVCLEESFSYFLIRYEEFFNMNQGAKVVNKKNFADLIKFEQGTLTGEVATMFLDSLTESSITHNVMASSSPAPSSSSSSLRCANSSGTPYSKKVKTSSSKKKGTTTSSSPPHQFFYKPWVPPGPSNISQESSRPTSTTRSAGTTEGNNYTNDEDYYVDVEEYDAGEAPPHTLFSPPATSTSTSISSSSKKSRTRNVVHQKNLEHFLWAVELLKEEHFFVFPNVGNSVGGGIGPSFIALLHINSDFVQLLPIDDVFDNDELALVIAQMLSMYTKPMSHFMLHNNGLSFKKDKYDTSDGTLSMFTTTDNEDRYTMRKSSSVSTKGKSNTNDDGSNNNWVRL